MFSRDLKEENYNSMEDTTEGWGNYLAHVLYNQPLYYRSGSTLSSLQTKILSPLQRSKRKTRN